MERLTEKIAGKVFLPLIPMDIKNQDDLETYHKVRKKYEKNTIKLAEYEDLEEQGLLVKVECHCKDCVHWADMCAGCTKHVKLCTVGGYMVGENGYCVYAEQKLKEMEQTYEQNAKS